jgi:DNA-binding SARP family transcriptional activator
MGILGCLCGGGLSDLRAGARQRGGVDLGVSGTRPKAPLALLVINRGKVVSADRIADAIWKGLLRSARSVLSSPTCLSHLRRDLGPDAGVLVTHQPDYVLEVVATAVDG